jgi:hypothetical protein
MRVSDLFFWRRHAVFERGDETIVVDYNLFTQRWTDAGHYLNGRLVETTRDAETLKGWIQRP